MQLWMRICLLRSVKSHKRVAKNEKIEVQFWMAVGCRYTIYILALKTL